MYKLNDPAFLAAELAKSAERRFLTLPAHSFIDELTKSYHEAEAEWEAADAAFADAVPITVDGALIKLRALADLLGDLGDNSLELRHVRSLTSYVEQLAAQSKINYEVALAPRSTGRHT